MKANTHLNPFERGDDIRGHYEQRTLNAVKAAAVEYYRKNGELDGAIPQEMFNHICDALKEKTAASINPFGEVGMFYSKEGPVTVVPLTVFGFKLLQLVYPEDMVFFENTCPLISQLAQF